MELEETQSGKAERAQARLLNASKHGREKYQKMFRARKTGLQQDSRTAA